MYSRRRGLPFSVAIHAHNINCIEHGLKLNQVLTASLQEKGLEGLQYKVEQKKFRKFSVISFMWNMPSLLTI